MLRPVSGAEIQHAAQHLTERVRACLEMFEGPKPHTTDTILRTHKLHLLKVTYMQCSLVHLHRAEDPAVSRYVDARFAFARPAQFSKSTTLTKTA